MTLCRNYSSCLCEAVPGDTLCIGCRAVQSDFFASQSDIDISHLSQEDVSFIYKYRNGCSLTTLAQYLKVEKSDLSQLVGQQLDGNVVGVRALAETIIGFRDQLKDITSSIENLIEGRSLPEEVLGFLKCHQRGCLLAHLSLVVGLKPRTATHLVRRGKIQARKVSSARRLNPGCGDWWVAFEEAVRISDLQCNWIGVYETVRKLKRLGVETTVDQIYSGIRHKQIGPVRRDLGGGKLLILLSTVLQLGGDLRQLAHSRRCAAGKRKWEKKNGELDADGVHAAFPKLPYKLILSLFGRGIISAEKRSGRWYTTYDKVFAFFGEVAEGQHRHGKKRLMPHTIGTCLEYHKQLEEN